MRIAMFDPYLGKFTADMCNWWRSRGIEVRVDRYYDPELVEWGDVIWWDTADNNLLSATKPGDAILGQKFFDNKEIPWDIHDMDLRNKKLICRPIDIEIWNGSHAHAEMWDLIDDCIFIAPHIRDMMMADSRPQESNMKIHTIPCGVDLSNWTFRDRGPGKKVGIVAERWVSKGIDYVIQLAMTLPDYEFHWLGKNNDYHWEHEYLKDQIKRNCPNLILEEEFVDDLDQWWEDKNYVLSASHKEAFGYNIAEAMAKGIKPVIHEFYGFEPLWGDSYHTWAKLDKAKEILTDDIYNSAGYVEYLFQKRYTIDQMMESIMEVING